MNATLRANIKPTPHSIRGHRGNPPAITRRSNKQVYNSWLALQRRLRRALMLRPIYTQRRTAASSAWDHLKPKSLMSEVKHKRCDNPSPRNRREVGLRVGSCSGEDGARRRR
jgi:hypothetical protein